MKPQLLIGALNSGSGKTTFTMGLLRSLQKQGLQVQPFKCGPDYIDTKFHSMATGNESVNLDTWLVSEEHVSKIYRKYGNQADICVIEGVMGLFDGYEKMKGSSAEIAMLLDIPVVLIINARSTAYTVAAQIYGVKNFCPDLNLAGVVFNNVSSAGHFTFLEDACRDAGVECFGYIPKSDSLEIPSRHLGLSIEIEDAMNRQIDRAAELVGRFVDIERMLECCNSYMADADSVDTIESESNTSHKDITIAVAKDAAFNFIYRENIAQFGRIGNVLFFSPLKGDRLPHADLVYLPGGYPELFAEQLQQQCGLIEDIRDFAENDGKIFAECGGMIFLSKGIADATGGNIHRFCGVLPFECTMQNARLHLGYREIVDGNGRHWRGHEFHYSNIADNVNVPASVAKQYNRNGVEVATPLFRYKNVIAGYTHFYWGEEDILKLWE